MSENGTKRVTYPISPEYVSKSWTVERALAEVIANALDEDAQPTVNHDGKETFTVEDSADGLRSRDLVLGISRKGDQSIGQFGEGLKIAGMVLARNRRIKSMTIETVGFTLRPLIVKEAFSALGDDEACEMLAFDITPNTRTSGTKVTVVGVKPEMAEKVTGRFLALQEPNYEIAPDPGRVLADRPGEIYIMGVFVQKRPDLRFGYDLSSASKRLQNRDRSVVDAWQLRHAIGEILAATLDFKTLAQMVVAMLTGKLAEEERGFLNALHTNPQMKSWMIKIGRELYGKDPLVCYQDYYDSDQETLLDLQDRGYELLEADGLDRWQSKMLFESLGVKSVKQLRKRVPKAQVTDWLRPDQLSETERTNLETATALIHALYGVKAIDKVTAYEATRFETADEELHWGGFYDPKSGRIGIQRLNLRALNTTLDVLIHEVAHRLGHKSGRVYADRTREFEWQLGVMASQMVMKLHALGALDSDLLAALPEELNSAQQDKTDRNTPSQQVRRLIAQQADKQKMTRKQLGQEVGLSTNMVAKLRSDADGSIHSVPSLKEVSAICDKIGLDAKVVWLALYSTKMSYVSRNKKGRIYGNGRVADFNACIAHVEAFGGEWKQVAAELRKQVSGETLTPPKVKSRFAAPRGDEEWLEPYYKLADREASRINGAPALQVAAAV